MLKKTRREFIRTSTALTAGLVATASAKNLAASSPNDELQFAGIGLGIRGAGITGGAATFARCMVLCDVDKNQIEKTKGMLTEKIEAKKIKKMDPEGVNDYRDIISRDDIDFVVIGTPDHWHAKIAIEAMLAGKDVYCEKPMTLTIAEGRQIVDTQKKTGRIFQVGTQQRSMKEFQQAVALEREQRVGKLKRITCGLGGAPKSKVLPVAEIPNGLDWDLWLGPAKKVKYRSASEPAKWGYGAEYPHSRCHAHFRWWYEYSGGKLTDWGAHHVDIAMWAMNKSDGSIGHVTIDPMMVKHPVEFKDGMPTVNDQFNTANEFHVRVTFADGIEMDLRHHAKDDLKFGNGIMFQGESGRFFVNRSKITGKPVEDLEAKPLNAETYDSIYKGLDGKGLWHMKNFIDCVRSRETPISDVASHHRHLSICHAANIAMRLGRKLTFDPAIERFIGDDRANEFLSITPRIGFETQMG